MFQPGGSSLPSSSVELSLRCERLRDLDTFSKSDPFCVVECKTLGIQNEWMEVGRTECVMDNLNPVWQKKIVLDYNFEQRQMLRLRVYDLDSESVGSKLESQDFLGVAECSLGEVVSKQMDSQKSLLKEEGRRYSLQRRR
jgi:Ca2+-dependent lipid-binding protein